MKANKVEMRMSKIQLVPPTAQKDVENQNLHLDQDQMDVNKIASKSHGFKLLK